MRGSYGVGIKLLYPFNILVDFFICHAPSVFGMCIVVIYTLKDNWAAVYKNFIL